MKMKRYYTHFRAVTTEASASYAVYCHTQDTLFSQESYISAEEAASIFYALPSEFPIKHW